MHNDNYSKSDVLSLIDSDFVTPQTSIVLKERMRVEKRIDPAFFSEHEFSILEGVCNCLIPQDDSGDIVPIAILFEISVANGPGKGWRHEALPSDKEMFKQGLNATDEEAHVEHSISFLSLSLEDRNSLLLALQQKKTKAVCWHTFPSDLFFIELLALISEVYYSHPLAKAEIGDVSFADAKGWQKWD